MKNILLLSFCLILTHTIFAQSATAYMDEADKLIQKQDYEAAFIKLSTAINTMPDSLLLYDMRGTMLEALGLYSEAIHDFTSGIEKAENSKFKSHLLANRGGTKSRLRDFQGSYKDLTKAMELDPDNLDALNNLATVCDEMGKPAETLKYLNQIIEIDPTYVPAYVNLGFAFQAMDKHKEAIVNFDKAVELAPEEPLAYSNRSFSKLKINDLKGAMEDINKSIEFFPTNSYAYKIRALINVANGSIEAVCKDLNQAEELGYTQQYGEEVQELKAKHCQ